ncbi:S-layer homology domain-containing protein [Halobacillus sp. BBL2006]|uniref:S-layer homology domain-containing protein n=1 Tax=Halobacillus sp. BBL2006 TaxID=1543706 RepID=UPI000541D9EC|nr:S-layer homology domain-containing protein [Halobacillus sp. BBL2006]KHE73215.1 hypothetical protein LD39_00435 [Halobacillus sp. BBL2006]
MKIMKTAVLVVTVMLFISSSNVYAERYNPVDVSSHWAEPEITQFVRSNLVKGYESEDGSHEIRPNQSITRAEFVTILNRVLELKKKENGMAFTDVKGGWYEENIYIASSNELIEGVGDQKFEPNRPITRAEIAAVIVRALEEGIDFSIGSPKKFRDVPSGHWALSFINKSSRVGIIHGVTEVEFKPYRNASRAEAIVMIKRALDQEKSESPNEAKILELVNEYNHEWKAALETNDIDRLKAVEGRTEGYFYALQTIMTHYSRQSLEDAGVTFDFTMKSDIQSHATTLSNRFAVVKITRADYEETATRPQSEPYTHVLSDAGIYRLHKKDGEWKIYDKTPDN